MIYEELPPHEPGPRYQFTLTSQEFDHFFDPYDPSDTDLPSYMHRNRVRFIKEWIYEWLVENIGQARADWLVFGEMKIILFKDKDKAMLFKLTHSLIGD